MEKIRQEIARLENQIDCLCKSGLSDLPIVEHLQDLLSEYKAQLKNLETANNVAKSIKR